MSSTNELEASLQVSIEKFRRVVSRDSKSDKDLAFRNLGEALLRECEGFFDIDNDLVQISVRTRNIFELYLVLQHLTSDPKQVESWLGQMGRDFTDVQEGFIQLFQARSIDSSGLEDELDRRKSYLKDSPYPESKPFNVRRLAVLYGFEDDYVAVYKLCSKILHASSVKVNGYRGFVADSSYSETLQHVAVSFAIKAEECFDDF